MAHARKPIPEIPPPRPAMFAPGVAYVAHDSGLRVFNCKAYRATLTINGCGARWREAQVARGEREDRLHACRGCPIGAHHAGYEPVRYSPLYGVLICPRCGKGTTRMIGNRRCVSCYNREREMRSGRNARGNRPVELLQAPLRAIELHLAVNDNVRRLRDRESSGLPETMMQTLRTTKGEVVFAFAGPERLLRQGRLF